MWTESLWGDEAFSAMAVQKPFVEMLGVVMRDTAPPLFYVLGYLWGQAFGFSEVSLRSLSLLLMLGTGVFAGLIVWNVRKKWLEAVLVGALAFLSPFLFKFGFEWRMYALLSFTTTGSVYFFVARKWRGYVLLTVAALYTHHFALFTVAGQGLWYLFDGFKWNKNWVRQLWPFWLTGLLYLPWIYPLYIQTTRIQGSGFWLKVPTVNEIVNLAYRFVVGGVDEKWRIVAWIGAGVVLLGKEWKKVSKKWLEVLFVVSAPVWIAVVVSYLVTPVFYDRYLLSVVAGAAVLVGMGTKKSLIPVLVILVAFYGYLSLWQFTHPSKLPFREFAAYVKSVKRPEDRLITIQGRAHFLWESKYYGIPAPIYTPNGPLPLFVGTAQMTEGDMIETLPTVTGRLGLITSDDLSDIKIDGYRMTSFENFDNLSISWWAK